jgi:hypothetical protein
MKMLRKQISVDVAYVRSNKQPLTEQSLVCDVAIVKCVTRVVHLHYKLQCSQCYVVVAEQTLLRRINQLLRTPITRNAMLSQYIDYRYCCLNLRMNNPIYTYIFE